MTPSEERPASVSDLSRLRIDRESAPPRRWLPWALLLVVIAIAAWFYPSARDYYTRSRAPEVEITRVTQIAPAANGGAGVDVGGRRRFPGAPGMSDSSFSFTISSRC